MFPDRPDRSEEIARLEREVEQLRYDVICLVAPDGLAQKLLAFGDCKTVEEFNEWERNIASDIADAARPVREWSDGGRRGRCPLCRDEGAGWGNRPNGYAIPAGIWLHLEGQGRATQCRVMEVVHALANEKMRPIEQAERQAKEAHKAERRKTERLYVTAPGKTCLIDDGFYYDDVPRDAERMAFAEARLSTFGFAVEVYGNVVAYKLPHPEFLILADPRHQKHIVFHVSERQSSGEVEQNFMWKSQWRRQTATFELHDRLTKNIGARFQGLLDTAIKTIEAKRPKPKTVVATKRPSRQRLIPES